MVLNSSAAWRAALANWVTPTTVLTAASSAAREVLTALFLRLVLEQLRKENKQNDENGKTKTKANKKNNTTKKTKQVNKKDIVLINNNLFYICNGMHAPQSHINLNHPPKVSTDLVVLGVISVAVSRDLTSDIGERG